MLLQEWPPAFGSGRTGSGSLACHRLLRDFRQGTLILLAWPLLLCKAELILPALLE